MKIENARFGNAATFEIAIQWIEDEDPPARRPARHGWSMGHVELTVAGVNLTASRLEEERQSHVGWYLAPMLDWLATNWVSLLHEEDFAWPTKDAAPGAIACRRALDFWVGSKDENGRRFYVETQAWYRRHGLRGAAAGGLFPDVFIRRLADDIELSWSGEAPPFGPEGLVFESGSGVSRLAVKDVAAPLWEALLWTVDNPPPLEASFREDWEDLCRKVDSIKHLGPRDFESAVIAEELLSRVCASFARIHEEEFLDEGLHPGRPFIDVFSPAVAMFGGVRPELSNEDVDALRDALVSAKGGEDSPGLRALVRDRRHLPIGGVPHEDGYKFAEDTLDDIENDFGDVALAGFVDIRAICERLEIEIDEKELTTDSIRGVALAGEGFRPKIIVNLTSVFNRNEDGKRFTIAHEVCHILFDRSRARRIAHTSGPWAAPGIEKRANAFAAYFLMPRQVMSKNVASTADFDDAAAIRQLANRLRVSESALVEHLYNLDFIDEVRREKLRSAVRPLSPT
ncbi:MAG: ImmA/IrrE family metallo-endopeptidase [Xanthobacteraceae bacterium]